MGVKRRVLMGLVLIGGTEAARATSDIRAPSGAWDATTFDFSGQDRSFPGIAIRLPDGKLFTACRIGPHQGCVFGYETDYQTVGDIVGQEFANPVLFCRCHLSVYDPAQRGRVLFGPAPRPPWLFDAREDHGTLTITSLEPGAGQIG